MTTKSETGGQSAGNTPVSAMAALQSSGFGNMMGLGIAWAEVLGDMSAEFLGFLAERIKEDVKTQHKILHCKDMRELQHIQAEFVQTAIEQYQVETGELMEISSSVFTDVMTGTRKT